MTLHINTIKNNSTEIEAGLKDEKGKWIIKKSRKARFKQAEKLLPMIEEIISGAKPKGKGTAAKKREINKKIIRQIEVVSRGGSFTSLRIGVVTANALGYSLGIPVKAILESGKISGENLKKQGKLTLVMPEYEKEPNITVKS